MTPRDVFCLMYFKNAGSEKDLRVSGWAKRLGLSLSRSYPRDNEYTRRAQYNVKLYAVFGKNESFLERR